MSEPYPWHDEMSGDEIAAVVARVSYKPGWTLTVDDSYYGRGVRHLLAQAPDVDDSRGGPPRTHYANLAFPARGCRTEEDVMVVVRRSFQEWESHEVDEWLRLDGEIHHDPHICRTCLIGGCRA